jgi:sulfur-oxidizing protein SoxX
MDVASSDVVGARGASHTVLGPSGLAYRIQGEGVPEPIAAAGDPAQGQEIVYGREAACPLCHQLPARQAAQVPPAGGDIGPPLAGVGARLSVAQLRLRMIDSRAVNPETVMPAYFRTDGLVRVASAYAGRPVLQAEQIEHVVAFLATLK